MITGFNTDVEFGGVIYHVQTEDKGQARPIISSLVYNRGTILASKRASYEDLLGPNFDEKVLSERLRKQHRLICAAIQAGRIDDLKKMNGKPATATVSVQNAEAKVEEKTVVRTPEVQRNLPPIQKPIEPTEASQVAVPSAESTSRNGFGGAQIDLAKSMPSLAPTAETKQPAIPIPPIPKPTAEDLNETSYILDESYIIDTDSIIEDSEEIEEFLLSPDAVLIIDEPSSAQSEPQGSSNELSVEILSSVKFRGGERNTIVFKVLRNGEIAVGGAQVMVKILGSAFRPVLFHSTTDDKGVASINLQFPHFLSGRAAFIVRVISDGKEIEIRRSIEHG